MVRSFGQTVPVDKTPNSPSNSAPNPSVTPSTPAPSPNNQTVLLPKTRPSRFGLFALLGASVMALFWIGVGSAFLWGYLGPQGLVALDPARKALAAAAVFLPAFLFLAVAAILARSVAM